MIKHYFFSFVTVSLVIQSYFLYVFCTKSVLVIKESACALISLSLLPIHFQCFSGNVLVRGSAGEGIAD